MAKYLKTELKPLYANFMRLKDFNKYLISKNFEYFCLTNDHDNEWAAAKLPIYRASKATIIVPGYTGYATEAFGLFLSVLYHSTSPFIKIIGDLLNDFQQWKNLQIDTSVISANLSNLGYSSKEISDFESFVAYMPTPINAPSKNMEELDKKMSRKIFIVHGHDNELKQHVARILEKLDLKPIILHEKPNSGQTIIEKIERYADEVQFAIILMTPDDEGRVKGDVELKTRARQNVVLEYGYFIGKYGRHRVVCLYKGVEELPSDMHGLIYIDKDNDSGWEYKLGKELKTAGYDVNLNDL